MSDINQQPLKVPSQSRELESDISTPEEEEEWRLIEQRQSHNLNSSQQNKIITQKGTQ